MIKNNSKSIEDLLKVLPNGNNQRLQRQVLKAYEFSMQAHNGQKRENGEECIQHNIATASILLPLEVDVHALIACIMLDILEPHTNIKAEEVRERFGDEVLALVHGVKQLHDYTKEKQVQNKENEENQKSTNVPKNGKKRKPRYIKSKFESIREAILTIIEGDIRVILLRMADCLQELRMAFRLPAEKQKKIAQETMQIYAPLANRLGIWHLKWELEDLAFRYLEPAQYQNIAHKLAERRAIRSQRIEIAAAKLKTSLRENGLRAEVNGRSKHIYSIYRKMQRKNLTFDELYDIEALRVILEPTDPEAYEKLNQVEKDRHDRALCYLALGAVHDIWTPISHEFDDYIANPKPNGYKSLHTAVLDKSSGHKLEIQIRTARMHQEAEKGVAAHWAYKEDGVAVSGSLQKRIHSLRELLTSLQESDESITINDEMLESEILADRIYVFTPQGDVVELPSGATPIDFAYQIHSSIGHRCRGARVDQKMVSLDYKLKTGQRVDIITTKKENPSRDWMNASLGYTVNPRTRSKIRQWFRKQERSKNIEQGREVVERELRRLNLSSSYSVEDIAAALKYDDVTAFLAKVGFGDIQSSQISGALALMQKPLKPDDEELRPLLLPREPAKKGITVLGTSGLQTKIAGCCNPIPPEKIIGYITRGQGITIHKRGCPIVAAINDRERLIDEIDWGIEAETFPIPIVVKAYRRPNLIDDMSNILRGQNISAPKTKTLANGSLLTAYLVVEVVDIDQLNNLLKKFENLNNVIEARRETWS